MRDDFNVPFNKIAQARLKVFDVLLVQSDQICVTEFPFKRILQRNRMLSHSLCKFRRQFYSTFVQIESRNVYFWTRIYLVLKFIEVPACVLEVSLEVMVDL